MKSHKRLFWPRPKIKLFFSFCHLPRKQKKHCRKLWALIENNFYTDINLKTKKRCKH